MIYYNIDIFKDMVFTGWASAFNDTESISEYDGRPLGFGSIAVNKDQIPLGTILEVETIDDGRKHIYTGIAQKEIELTQCEQDLTLKLWFDNNHFGKRRWVKITVKELAPVGGPSSGILGPEDSGSSAVPPLAPNTVVVIPEKDRYVDPKTGKKYGNSISVAYSEEGLTSRETRTGLGTIAVNPKIIPYYTRLSVKRKDGKLIYGKDKNGNVGYHEEYIGVALDTGGDVRLNKFITDLWMPEDKAENFGRADVEVKVIA